jgi:octaprenyl-diphosphate synthase
MFRFSSRSTINMVAMIRQGVQRLANVIALETGSGRSPRASVDPLMRLVHEDMGKVNRLILDRCGSDVEMIPEVARHLIDSGGKRLRPMLTLAAGQMCGHDGENHVLLAASVEFMHTATLLHDDVVDESDMRRGKLAARMLWGNQASVLVGDFLLGQAFRMMVEAGSLQALDVLSHAATVIAEGEVLQLSTAKNLETNEDEYLAVIRAKTAALFAAAAEVGPIISGSPKPVISAFRSYGANLGLAFQLIDDALDYGGSTALLGKNVGDDFREGKVTLPLVLAFRRGSDADRTFWRSAIVEGRNGDEELAHAMSLLRKYDAIADTVARARLYTDMARDALAPMKASVHKDALIEVLEFCVSRAT